MSKKGFEKLKELKNFENAVVMRIDSTSKSRSFKKPFPKSNGNRKNFNPNGPKTAQSIWGEICLE